MKRFIAALLMTLLSLSVLGNESVSLKPFKKDDWGNILAQAQGKPMAIHFWGVTCAPCSKEMPQWGKFMKQHPQAHVIFIQVDNVSPEMMRTMLIKANLGDADNYFLASDYDEYLWYRINPQWHGETPITITLNESGKQSLIQGPINFKNLSKLFQ